jgi:hypothetical protein
MVFGIATIAAPGASGLPLVLVLVPLAAMTVLRE